MPASQVVEIPCTDEQMCRAIVAALVTALAPLVPGAPPTPEIGATPGGDDGSAAAALPLAGGGGASGKRSLEGTFLSGCILTARNAADEILAR